MNEIIFPDLGLSFKVSKIAFTMFNVDIYWYAICIITGIALATIVCRLSYVNYFIKFETVIETMLFAIIFGVFGARLYYVIFNLDYYMVEPMKILDIRDGGLAIYGGLIAGALVVVSYAHKYKVRPIELLDYIAPFVALAQAIGRWGNFFNMEAYGMQTTFFMRMGLPIGLGGSYIYVHPTFLYESVADLLIYFLARHMQKNHKFAGSALFTYLILYSAVRFFIEFIRADALIFAGFRVSQVLSAVVFCISLVYFIYRYALYLRKKIIDLKDGIKRNT
jgi:phosphatidylglycerol:prolipoprotein diacylglycerol transferase